MIRLCATEELANANSASTSAVRDTGDVIEVSSAVDCREAIILEAGLAEASGIRWTAAMHRWPGRELRGAFAAAALVLLGGLSLGCATPVGVDRVSLRYVDRELSENLLTGDRPSAPSREYLERLALTELYGQRPREALEQLRLGLGRLDERGRLFALSELSFGVAEKSGDRGDYLVSALYAYAFLFPDD